MILPALFVATLQMSPAQQFDACVSATRRLKVAAFTVDAITRGQGKTYHNFFTVKYQQPDTLLITVQALKTESQTPSKRTYLINDAKLIAVDADSNEYLVRSFDAKKGLADRATEILGALDDSVKFQLSPDDLSKFFSDFKKLTGWKYQASRTGSLLDRVAGKAHVSFEFERHSLLKRVRISKAGSLLAWDYQYGPVPKGISLAIPPGAHKVDSFLAIAAPIAHFESPAVAKLWDRSVYAYSKLSSASMTTSIGGNSVQVVFDKNKAAQQGEGLSWAYDGHNLSLATPGHFRRGDIALRFVPGKVGEGIDPMLQAWALHRNPARNLSSQPMSVRLAGIVKVDGVTCDIVEFRQLRTRVSVLVRRTDHLFARLSSVTKDSKGRTVSSADREIRYTSVNQPVSPKAFELGPLPGQAVEKFN